MKEVDLLLLNTEHEIIKQVINQFDPQAEIILFGDGAKRAGRNLEIYINSKRIDQHLIKRIKDILINNYYLPIDLICNEKSITENVKPIGVCV